MGRQRALRTACRSGLRSRLLHAAIVPAAAAALACASALHAQDEGVAVAGSSIEHLVALIERLTDAPLYRNNAVRLLLDGPETHGAMLAAIGSAADHVHLETYIFAADEIGKRFADALAGAAARGVDVRLIYDGVGSRDAPPELFARLEEAGVVAHEYNDPLADADPRDVDTRDHRKLLIVDGAVAFTGGINIDRHYARPSRLTGAERDGGRSGWRDTHLEVRGPAVAGFQRLFVTLWQGVEGPLAEPLHSPRTAELEAGTALVRVLAGVGGNDAVSPIRLAFQAAAEIARERIWITQSYFAPDDVLSDAIGDAAARGVDVRILVAGYSDSKLVVDASRSYYASLLERGVRIYESRENILHAKTMVVDGAWSTIGSSNLDYLSFLHNHEANAIVVDAGFGARMEQVFEADLGHAAEIDLERWSRRSLWQRAKELYSRLMRYRL